MRTYNEKLQAYKDAKAEQELEQKNCQRRGPDQPQSALQRTDRADRTQATLHRDAAQAFNIQQGKSFYLEDKLCDVPYIRIGKNLATHAQRAKLLGKYLTGI